MYSENPSTLMSSDHQLEDPGNEGLDGQISQIPGLSPSIKSLNDEKARGRRTGVMDSDSDYIKLAKQGGHKGLLWHEEALAKKSNSYKPPNWFCSELDSSSSSQASLMSSEERQQQPRAAQRREPPFGTDNMSAWERDESGAGGEKNNNAHAGPMDKWQSSPPAHQGSRFKRTAFDKRPAPVDMSKLLSFGYADDDKPTSGHFASN